MFMPVGLAGLATKTKATAFVIFADGTYHETALNDNAAVRAAQAEAVKFNLMASSTPRRAGNRTTSRPSSASWSASMMRAC